MPKLTIVKIGGAVIENEGKLVPFLKDFSQIKGPKILVHGGGKKASLWAEKLDIPVKMNAGRRITDAATLELISGLYAGQINKKIVAHLQAFQCNALGLSGPDGNALLAEKRSVKPIDYGYVGDIVAVNTSFFSTLLHQGITPVCCAISHDGNGQLLNTNADTVTSEIGQAMSKDYETRLQYCFELPGVLKSLEDPNSLITNITLNSYQTLLDNGYISEGMIPKLENAFEALRKGVKEVGIGSTKMILKNILYTSITLK
jgi:acetylglutamate kinase